ncbi:hypothetical protein P7C70_g1350, partial [Phenoliferia sp. Uapishka_3]
MPNHHQTITKLSLVKNEKHKKNGAAALAKAAHRYGFTAVEQGYFISSSGRGTQVRRKKHHSSPSGGEGETEVPVTDISSDLEYVVSVGVGTPSIQMQLDFDTGSSDLWVWSSEYKGTGTSGHAIYNPAKSTTAKRQTGSTWSISYGDGSMASGDVYTDSVALGSITIPNQAIELASKLSSSFLQGGSDGLLGLAWPSINTVTPNAVATPVENMINEKLINSSIFSVKLTKGGVDGFYTFGEIDSSVTNEPILYAPVDNSQGFWSFPSTTFTVNGESQTLDGGSAIADTGTTLMLLPDSAVTAIYDAIPGAKLDSSQGGYVYPASATIPSLTFAVGDNFFTLNAEDFAYGDATDGFVFGGIQSAGNLGFSIFGDIFLKSVYVVFDQGSSRIGMAQRSD